MRRIAFISIALWLLSISHVFSQTGDVVASSDATWSEKSYNLDSLTVNNGATLTIAGGSTVNVAHTVTVTGNSKILLQGKNITGQVDGQWAGAGVTISAADIQIASGSQISADACGYGPYLGPGGGGSYVTGGTYGGRGSGNTLPAYGSYLFPTDLGSGGGAAYGGSSSGGGAIRLIVSGTLTNNGTITADGYANSVGNTAGGSGGSIYVETGTIAGSGTFTANGGAGANPALASGQPPRAGAHSTAPSALAEPVKTCRYQLSIPRPLSAFSGNSTLLLRGLVSMRAQKPPWKYPVFQNKYQSSQSKGHLRVPPHGPLPYFRNGC